jgi:hypothetical protein
MNTVLMQSLCAGLGLLAVVVGAFALADGLISNCYI